MRHHSPLDQSDNQLSNSLKQCSDNPKTTHNLTSLLVTQTLQAYLFIMQFRTG